VKVDPPGKTSGNSKVHSDLGARFSGNKRNAATRVRYILSSELRSQ
jgi:hypothetical protein